MKNKLVILAGPSGSGKSTIIKSLLEGIPSLSFSISATTRECRANEMSGRDYYFLGVEDFRNKIANNEFVEYEEVYSGMYYGTLRSEIQRLWDSGQNVIFDIDVVGALNIKKMYPELSISVLVMPPSIDELKNRLIRRGTETPESIIKRVGKAEKELAFADKFDKRIINDDLNASIEEATLIVNEFLRR